MNQVLGQPKCEKGYQRCQVQSWRLRQHTSERHDNRFSHGHEAGEKSATGLNDVASDDPDNQ